MRLVVNGNMPYDTGFMFLAGAKFFDNDHFQLVKYDVERVPYIVYNEEGTRFTQVNKGFIRNKTVGDLLRHQSYQESGDRAPMLKLEDRAKRRGSFNMIKQGALEKIKSER